MIVGIVILETAPTSLVRLMRCRRRDELVLADHLLLDLDALVGLRLVVENLEDGAICRLPVEGGRVVDADELIDSVGRAVAINGAHLLDPQAHQPRSIRVLALLLHVHDGLEADLPLLGGQRTPGNIIRELGRANAHEAVEEGGEHRVHTG